MKLHGIGTAVAGVVVSLALATGAAAAGNAAGTWNAKCKGCHGADGKGNEKMVKPLKTDAAHLDLTDAATQGETDAALGATVTNGKDKMPSFKGKLKDDEIAGMVAYVRGLAKGGGAAATAPAAAGSTAAPASWSKSCAACHGADAKGNPKMAGAMKVDAAALDLVDAATLAKTDAALIKIITDGEGKMPGFGKKLSADEIKAIVAWLRKAGA